MDIYRKIITGYSELLNTFAAFDISILEYEPTTHLGIAKYNKCETNLTFSFAYDERVTGWISILNLYNNGIFICLGEPYVYIAPEADEDTWILLTQLADQNRTIRIKTDENAEWRSLFNTETMPTFNGIQLVNYFDFDTQRIFGNLYICKKLPVYRLVNRYYHWKNAAVPDERFPNIGMDRVMDGQHFGNYSNTPAPHGTGLFGECIRIDDKIYIITDAHNWDYGTNSLINEGDTVRNTNITSVAFRVT